MGQWWGKPNSTTGKHDASKLLITEVAVLKQQFPKHTAQEINPETYWDHDFWIYIEDIQTGFHRKKQFYFILTIKFGAIVDGPDDCIWEDQFYKIKVLYPKGEKYPAEAPLSFMVYPTNDSSKHVWPRGSLCLFKPDDGRSYGWDPSRDNGTTIALWAIQWIRAYRTYKKIGVWPGREV